MKDQSHLIHELLTRYRENRCSREEYEKLIQLAQIPGNEMVFKEIMLQDWEGSQLEGSIVSQIPSQNGRRIGVVGLKVAATIAILIIAGFALLEWLTVDPVAYATGNGEVMEITLPDGSEATLNANSNLTWVPAKDKGDDRLVRLTGEAFFHVVKEKLSKNDQETYRGFQVSTPKMTVYVLGTSFNVAARSENTEIFLEEGSVKLELDGEELASRHMIPGDKVTMNNHTGIVTEKKLEEVSTSASWVTGILNYHDQSMEEVLRNLSELFGVEISCEDPSLNSKRINLGVPYMDWENTRRALEMAIDVEFRKVGDRYKVVQSNETKK